MEKFITVKKDSPEFKKYLENRFTTDYRAIPVESQNINTDREIVTFEMKPTQELSSLSWSQIFLPLLKVNKFLYFYFPLFYVVASLWTKDLPMDPITMVLSWLGITALFLAVNLRSDYIDHMIGLDRILKKTATKPVSLGWISAYRVKQLSYGFFTISVLLGIPVVIAFPVTLFAIAVSTIIIFWAVLRKRESFRSHILGDLGWSLLLGPVLSVGFELSVRGHFLTETLLFGFVWSSVVFYRIQLQNFEVIVEASVVKIKNGITWLGFDKGKDLILILWGLSLILFSFYQLMYSHWLYWISIVVICAVFTFKSRNVFRSLSSPLGSEMALFIKEYHQLYVLLTSLWCVSLTFGAMMPLLAKFF